MSRRSSRSALPLLVSLPASLLSSPSPRFSSPFFAPPSAARPSLSPPFLLLHDTLLASACACLLQRSLPGVYLLRRSFPGVCLSWLTLLLWLTRRIPHLSCRPGEKLRENATLFFSARLSAARPSLSLPFPHRPPLPLTSGFSARPPISSSFFPLLCSPLPLLSILSSTLCSLVSSPSARPILLLSFGRSSASCKQPQTGSPGA